MSGNAMNRGWQLPFAEPNAYFDWRQKIAKINGMFQRPPNYLSAELLK